MCWNCHHVSEFKFSNTSPTFAFLTVQRSNHAHEAARQPNVTGSGTVKSFRFSNVFIYLLLPAAATDGTVGSVGRTGRLYYKPRCPVAGTRLGSVLELLESRPGLDSTGT